MLAPSLCFAILLASSHTYEYKPPKGDLEWWQKATFYQVYPRSFQDSDNDGVGDLKGIESRLDYLVDLGVKGVWLSPIYKSPMADFGYDISDFADVDPTFGTLHDFKSLVSAMKQRGLKIVMDFVPNHSSNRHVWFQKSARGEDPYTYYYIWAQPRGYADNGEPIPPNNWISVFGGSAWTYNQNRGAFYLHQFTEEQPDLNFRNPLVLQEMLNVLRFWLNLGVDGFRVDATPHLFEDPQLRDEPPSWDSHAVPDTYGTLDHIYTKDLPELYDVMAKFREVLDDHAANTNGITRVMMTEAYTSVENTMLYYGNSSREIAHLPFNFFFVSNLHRESTAQDFYRTIRLWLDNMPEGKWANWVIGNHDNHRVADRFGRDFVDSLNIVSLLLPGSAVTYYGEEIGMEDTFISWENTVDPSGRNAGHLRYLQFTRDPERTPMQWDATENSGFSKGRRTWLPVNQNYRTLNVEDQKTYGSSHLGIYKRLQEARRKRSVQQGTLYMDVANDTLVFAREIPGSQSFYAAVNIGRNRQFIDIRELRSLPDASVFITTSTSKYRIGDMISTGTIEVEPRQAVVLQYTPSGTSREHLVTESGGSVHGSSLLWTAIAYLTYLVASR